MHEAPQTVSSACSALLPPPQQQNYQAAAEVQTELHQVLQSSTPLLLLLHPPACTPATLYCAPTVRLSSDAELSITADSRQLCFATAATAAAATPAGSG
jgi:hypothetical protein